jgi:vitamin B12 transporter
MNPLPLTAAILPLLAVAVPSAAEPLPPLPPIVITPGRVAQSATDTLASTTVLDRADIEHSQARSVLDLLNGLPGISLSTVGGLGQQTSLFLRGTESDQVLVLIDGIKVGSATAGTTPFEHLPVELIERVEIVRGPRSSLYGSEAIGGVIQIFTRRGGGDLKPSLSLGAGSYDTYEGAVSLAGGGQHAWFNAGVSGAHTNGFNACSGDPVTFAGCATWEPDSDGYRNLSRDLRAGYRFANDT